MIIGSRRVDEWLGKPPQVPLWARRGLFLSTNRQRAKNRAADATP